jgi:ribosomal protein S27E
MGSLLSDHGYSSGRATEPQCPAVPARTTPKPRMSESEDRSTNPRQNAGPSDPEGGEGRVQPSTARPSRPLQRASAQGDGDALEMRRLASAAFGGAGRGDGFHFGCPECAHPITVESSAAGARIACPECGARIDVPAIAPVGQGSVGGGVTRPANLPAVRAGLGTGETQQMLAGTELRQAHDDQHRLNPDRKLKFIPFEGTVARGRVGAPAGSRSPLGPSEFLLSEWESMSSSAVRKVDRWIPLRLPSRMD